jgi:hypothetical protein
MKKGGEFDFGSFWSEWGNLVGGISMVVGTLLMVWLLWPLLEATYSSQQQYLVALRSECNERPGGAACIELRAILERPNRQTERR